MKKVIAVMGSAQKRATYQAVREFEKGLKQYEDIDFEYVFLHDYRLEFCMGCKQCFDKGEHHCPLKDDRDVLLGKMEQADGVIFATPNYTFQVSARMKNFLDRFAFIFHRPRFFGKTCTAIVTQGVFGGKAIMKYLQTMGVNLGFTAVKGAYVTTLEPMTAVQQQALLKQMRLASDRFYKGLARQVPPVPSLFRLMLFRVQRTILKLFDIKLRDYYHFQENGWLESDYYYATSLGPLKKTAGRLFDLIGRRMAKHM